MWLSKVLLCCTLIGLASCQKNVEHRDTRSNYMLTLPSHWGNLDKKIAELGSVWNQHDRAQKIQNIVKCLTEAADKAQDSVIKYLKTKLRIKPEDITPFWLTNSIKVANMNIQWATVIEQGHPGIKVAKEVVFTPIRPKNLTRKHTIPFINRKGVQPNVKKIGAETLWADGYSGEYILIGIIDSGVRVTHNCLKDNYDGTPENGNPAAWYDPVYGETDPYDDDGHGTLCIGIAAGTCGIGAAPNATFIACSEDKTEGAITSCMQFMTCPKANMSDENEQCGRVPDVVTNSWGVYQNYTGFNDVIKMWEEQMNTLAVFAIGNHGEDGCSTAASPGMQPDVFSVGATNNTDYVAPDSSRGPGANDNVVPSVVAPGVGIFSASKDSDTELVKESGTSMATPLVAGAAALLMSYDLSLSATEIRQLIVEHGVVKGLEYDGDSCGDEEDPNNVYGYGRVDVAAAYNYVKAKKIMP